VASQAAYEVVFASAALEFFVGLGKRPQRKLLDRAHELAQDPFLLPDFYSQDSTGRDISHFMADGFVFDFWVDHAVKQVIVSDVDFVD
jgi:hypothetical protein